MCCEVNVTFSLSSWSYAIPYLEKSAFFVWFCCCFSKRGSFHYCYFFLFISKSFLDVTPACQANRSSLYLMVIPCVPACLTSFCSCKEGHGFFFTFAKIILLLHFSVIFSYKHGLLLITVPFPNISGYSVN